MIYDMNGNVLSAAYGMGGTPLERAYDADGNIIFTRDVAPMKTAIKVMSYNVGKWYTGISQNAPAEKENIYYRLQKSIIDTVDADVVEIQEYSPYISETKRTVADILYSKYPYCIFQTGSGEYLSRAICSKFPIGLYTTNFYTSETSRYYDRAEVYINGQMINFINTHLALRASDRASQIAELIAYIKSLNGDFVLMGDFNMTAYSDKEEAYKDIITPLMTEGWNIANGVSGWIGTYSSATTWGEDDGVPLDNIVSNLPISHVGVDTTKLTDDVVDIIDHIPLYATITLTND